MIRGFIVLVLALAGWWAVLWRLIAPDFSQWRIPPLAALHFGPPLVLWVLWTFWRRHRRERAAAAAEARESAADQERQGQRDEARQHHATELERLRYGCDCRALALAHVVPPAGAPDALVPEGESICFSSVAVDAQDAAENTLLDHLRPGIEEALGAIYNRCPAATAFPLYVSPPPDTIGEAVVACLRQVRAQFVADLGRPVHFGPEFNRVLFLPARESVADSVIGLFETDPELPAAVILAFDSPWWRGRLLEEEDGEAADPGKTEQRQWMGPPSQGVVALFLTHPQLPEMLAAAPMSHDPYDALTPYWEKNPAVVGGAALLASLSEAERADLQDVAPLARIHRAASTRFGAQAPRSMEFARAIEALIERAQIHAALIELPFDPPASAANAAEAMAAPDSPPKPPAPDCGWLIHNAGAVDCSGTRLAALGVALFRRGLELDPIAAATNVTVKAGDFGQARGAAMLAMTVARAASGESAALCAEFAGHDGLSLFFATAPQSAA